MQKYLWAAEQLKTLEKKIENLERKNEEIEKTNSKKKKIEERTSESKKPKESFPFNNEIVITDSQNGHSSSLALLQFDQIQSPEMHSA